MAVLKAENAVFTYENKNQKVVAVKGVSAEFETGKSYAIVGKSGSGKTTFLSLLAGLELPTEGEILFDGVSTRTLNCDLYRRDDVAVIYQSYNLFPLLTAEENVAYPLRLKKINKADAKARAREELLAVGISENEFGRFPSQLSGGQQQRVSIARALAAGNRVILADEPTGNLDSENSEQVMDILLRLSKKESRCVIIVTHDMDLASKTDVTLTMKDGYLSAVSG